MSIFGLGKKKDDGSNSNFSGKNGNEPSESQDNLSLIEEKIIINVLTSYL